MARIRTVKPEFWEDETVASCSRDARLLFIATFNMADDEGLLRWTPEYIKANAFMYDDDLTTADVEKLMQELTDAELLLPYRAGRPQRQLAWVINFRKHQNINRPQPGKLPPPSIQNNEVWAAYKRRDGMVCHLCGAPVSEGHDEPKLFASLDHVVPRSKGGSDYPSNIKLAHVTCNKARCDREIGESPSQHAPSLSHSLNDSVNDSLSSSRGHPSPRSVTRSPQEQGREQGREQGSGSRDAREAQPGSSVLGCSLLDEHLAKYEHKPPKSVIQKTGGHIDRLLDEGFRADDIRTALAIQRSKPNLGPGVLPTLVNEVIQKRTSPNGHASAPGPDRARGWVAAGAAFQAQMDQSSRRELRG